MKDSVILPLVEMLATSLVGFLKEVSRSVLLKCHAAVTR